MSTEYELNETPLEDWIDEGVSFLQAKVTIYRNPALYAQYQPLLDQIRSLEQELAPKKQKAKKDASLEESLGDAPVGEEALGEDSLTTAMNERLEELYELDMSELDPEAADRLVAMIRRSVDKACTVGRTLQSGSEIDLRIETGLGDGAEAR